AEQMLTSTGQGRSVSDTRHLYQQAMKDDFTAAVERLTGRKVAAFVSGNHLDPDIAVEIFILESRQATT
nr:Na-translocating system protein MpsC family protein [Baekduia sp.]